MNINVTDLSSYDYCKRKLFLTRVLRMEEPAKDVVVRGSIRHKATEEINKIEESIIKNIDNMMVFEDLFAMLRQRHSEILVNAIKNNKKLVEEVNLDMTALFKDLWPNIAAETEQRARTIHDFISKEKVLGEELWKSLVPKIKTELWLESNRLRLRGYLDKIEVYHYKMVPLELKTGRAPREGVWPGHRLQIGAYCMLAKEVVDSTINQGFIHYLDSKEQRKVVLNPFLESEIAETTGKVINLFENKALPKPCGNENKCNKCALKNVCFDEKIIREKVKVI